MASVEVRVCPVRVVPGRAGGVSPLSGAGKTGGLTELRWIDAPERAHEVPVIPHAGWRGGAADFDFANRNTPWCEMILRWPGGPKEVYERFEEENPITRGPEGIYMRPPERPGFGFELKTG
jgi:L-alanine-DL-glutamate epimerase-like enolase superfamily enzyme